MRKTIGSICYGLGGLAGVLAVQLLVGCELLAAFSKVENQRYEFWSFVLVTDGHHRAYPNGYLVHLLRDLFIMLFAFAVIRLGRQQFVYRKKTRMDKVELMTCLGVTRRLTRMPIADSVDSTSLPTFLPETAVLQCPSGRFLCLPTPGFLCFFSSSICCLAVKAALSACAFRKLSVAMRLPLWMATPACED
jgi:hypothetical protein